MKNITTLLLALLLVVMPVHGGSSARFTPTDTSTITIKGTSTMHDWTMAGAAILGAIDTDPDVWKAAGEKPARVTVSIPVASIKSEHKKMDALMQEALKAKTNPEIRYEMTSAAVTKVEGDAFVVRANGKLTIAGTTRDVTMNVTAQRAGDRQYILTGETPIRLPDYGIKPPTAMLGAIKTGADVKVAFRWIVARG